jgi:hypothetical protein
MEVVSNLLTETSNEELKKVIARELQKIKLIPLDMFSAKEAINNIMTAEILKKNINFQRTIPSLMSLNLESVSTRSKFRFDDYYKRFYKSRNRGFDFEGMIAGFLDGDIADDKNSPYDINVKGVRLSLKTLNSESESPVIRSLTGTIKKYYDNYEGSEENKLLLKSIISTNNPIKGLVDSGNDDMKNIAEDIVTESLMGVDAILIGVPKENNVIYLYYFTKENIANLSTIKGAVVAPKSTGSKQLRMSSSILPEADLFGKITFPILTDEDYSSFLIGDETTNQTIDILNKLGNKYGVNGLGGQLPQDIVMDLAKSQQFITDMNFILNSSEE